MKTLRIIALSISLLGLTSCAHHAKKACCKKDKKSCELKEKKAECKKKNCDGKSCDLEKKN